MIIAFDSPFFDSWKRYLLFLLERTYAKVKVEDKGLSSQLLAQKIGYKVKGLSFQQSKCHWDGVNICISNKIIPVIQVMALLSLSI